MRAVHSVTRAVSGFAVPVAVWAKLFADKDFRKLLSSAGDETAPAVIEFYAHWLPAVSGVDNARVRLQETDSTYTYGVDVGLNVASAQRLRTDVERLAFLHATMWHEAAHVRHPVSVEWINGLYERHGEVGERRVFAAFQSLEDLRVERELLSVRPEARPWLRYNLCAGGTPAGRAVRCGRDPSCGWALAATIFGGRVVARTFDMTTVQGLQRADPRLVAAIDELWHLWDSYSVLTDAERDAGIGDRQIRELAERLPAHVGSSSTGVAGGE